MKNIIDLESAIVLHTQQLRAGIITGNESLACSSAGILSRIFGPIEAMKPTLPTPPWVIEHA